MSYLRTIFVCFFLYYLLAIPYRVFADGHPIINEFLPHPDTDNKEWVELYIPDGSDVSKYWIDDDTDFLSDTGSSSKKQMTAIVQGSDSHHVVFELSSSMFNNDGDTVALFASDGTLVDQYQYASDPGVDISIGRTPDATGTFQVLASATRGSSNSNPLPTVTPTPAPTDKPTKEPNPTDTPKPSKNTISIPTTLPTKSIFASAITSSVKNNAFPISKVGSVSAYPTSILGISTKSAEKKIIKNPKKSLRNKDSSSSPIGIIIISIGGLLLLVCGILMYLKKKGKIHF